MASQASLFPCSGCGFLLTLQQFPVHLVSCAEVNIACALCKQVMNKNQLNDHYGVCERRLISCSRCLSHFFANAQAEHEAKCAEWVMKRKFVEEIKDDISAYVKELISQATEELKATHNKRHKPNNESPPAAAHVINTAERTRQPFEVEEILDRQIRNGVQLFHIKWKPVNGMVWENTWEPRSSLRQCPELLAQFEACAAAASTSASAPVEEKDARKGVGIIRDGAGHKSDVSRLLNKWILKQPVESIADRTTQNVWNQFVQEVGKDKVLFKFNSDFFRKALRSKKAKDPKFSQLETPFKPRNGMLLKVSVEDNHHNNMQDEDEESSSSSSEQESSSQLSEAEQICVDTLGNIPIIQIRGALNPYGTVSL